MRASLQSTIITNVDHQITCIHVRISLMKCILAATYRRRAVITCPVALDLIH